MKKLLILSLVLTVLGTTSVPTFAATANKTNEVPIESSTKAYSSTLTVNSYISWLNENIKKTNGTEKKNFQTTLNKFKSLNNEQQNKFINYMNNPQFIKDALNFANNSNSDKLSINADKLSLSSSQLKSNKVLKYNNDITVTVNSSFAEETPKDPLATMLYSSGEHKIKATYTHSITCMGVDVLQAVIWVRYITDGEDVTSVTDADAFTGTNFNPVLSTDWSDAQSDYNSQKAWATADLTFSFIYKTSMTKIRSCEVGVEGDVDKNIDGWVNEY